MAYSLLRLRLSQTEPEPVTEVNIIPVIDISLVLLVILFVTAPLLSVPSLPVSLPQASLPEAREDSIALTCAADGRLAVRAVEVEWAGLEAALGRELRKKPQAPVLLRVDRSVPYRTVQKLMAAAKSAGAESIALATEPRR